MSLEIRSDILNKSLQLENKLSDIIKQIIHVPKSKTKTLGNQSSALSFKTKADLLLDLDRIDKDDYNHLLLFMEIRNQFIHNIEADSFCKTFEIIGRDRRKRILRINSKLDQLYTEYEKLAGPKEKLESILRLAFDELYNRLNKLIASQIELLIRDLKKERELEVNSKAYIIAMDMLKIVQETTEEFGKVYSGELEKLTGSKSSIGEILNNYINQKSIEKLKKKYPELPD